jgi:hypothetical protein
MGSVFCLCYERSMLSPDPVYSTASPVLSTMGDQGFLACCLASRRGTWYMPCLKALAGWSWEALGPPWGPVDLSASQIQAAERSPLADGAAAGLAVTASELKTRSI